MEYILRPPTSERKDHGACSRKATNGSKYIRACLASVPVESTLGQFSLSLVCENQQYDVLRSTTRLQ